MKKMIYFYILLSIPCSICIFLDITHVSVFAMTEKVEKPIKIEKSEEVQLKRQKEQHLQTEEKLLQQQKQQKEPLAAYQKQLTQDIEKSDTTAILVSEKPQDVIKQDEETAKAQILTKKLTEELETSLQKTKSLKKGGGSPLAICIKNLIMDEMAKSRAIIENKDNEEVFNELSASLEKLSRYEANKFGSDYYDMTTNGDIEKRRTSMLNIDPSNKDYDQAYVELITEQQALRAKINELLQKKTNKPGLIDTIINGCVNRAVITIIKKEKEAAESILSN